MELVVDIPLMFLLEGVQQHLLLLLLPLKHG